MIKIMQIRLDLIQFRIEEDALITAYDLGHRLRILLLYFSIRHSFYLRIVAEEPAQTL